MSANRFSTRPEDNGRISPPLTREQINDPNVREFHAGQCSITYGTTGRARPTVHSEIWRRNGAVQTWKRDPARFRLPIKHGLYAYGDITESDLTDYAPVNRRMHAANVCAALAEESAYWAAQRANMEGNR